MERLHKEIKKAFLYGMWIVDQAKVEASARISGSVALRMVRLADCPGGRLDLHDILHGGNVVARAG